jgi:hypothetical protein
VVYLMPESNYPLMVHLLLLFNLVLSAFLTGLIWFVQVVHYPIFRKVPASHYLAYHLAHTNTTGQLVAAPMLAELLIGGWLAMQTFPGSLRWINYAGYGCVLLIWAVTFLIAIPLHNKLSREGYNIATIDSLVTVNWMRTLLWTVRTALLVYLLYGKGR